MDKCLHILPMNKISGAEKMALLICKNLKEYEPIVVCGGEVLRKVFSENNIPAYKVDFSKKNILTALKDIDAVIKAHDIKIIHAHDNTASIYGYLVKKIYKDDVKVISHIHNCYPWVKDGGINKKIDKFIRKKYDYNIACGSTVYKYYKENTDYFEEDKISILSNAMDIKEIEQYKFENEEELRKEFNLPRNKKILGYIGRLDEQKAILPFIKALSPHRDRFHDSKILMIGNGYEEQEVKKLVEELKLQDLIVLTGFQNNTYRFYPLMDLFFLPSKYEGLPMVLLEAMAFKKPIVSMNVGSIEEVLGDERGKLIEPGHYEGFIKALIILKDNEGLRKKYGEAGYRYLKENYEIVKYVHRLEGIYRRVEEKGKQSDETDVNSIYTNLQ